MTINPFSNAAEFDVIRNELSKSVRDDDLVAKMYKRIFLKKVTSTAIVAGVVVAIHVLADIATKAIDSNEESTEDEDN